MSEMKEMIVDVVEKIFKDHVEKETVDLVEKGQWAEAVWGILTENEILNVAIAESRGGAGGDLDDLLSLYQLIGQYAVPIPFVETTFANYILETLHLTNTTNKATYSLSQDSVHLNDDNTVTGSLINIPWARHVDDIVLLAHNQQGILHAVHIALADTVVTPSANLAGEPRDTVVLKNAKIQQRTTRPLTEAEVQFFETLDTAAKNALMTGAIKKAFDLTVSYSKEREQFGRPIHRFQLVQQHIAYLAGEQAIASAAFENMVAALVEKRQQHEVAYTRIRLDEASKIVSTSAHQVHAAIGVTHEHSLHQYTRRLWAWRDEGLTVSYWKKDIANALLATDKENIWAYLSDAEKVYQTY